jgi:hypothetical protein
METVLTQAHGTSAPPHQQARYDSVKLSGSPCPGCQAESWLVFPILTLEEDLRCIP